MNQAIPKQWYKPDPDDAGVFWFHRSIIDSGLWAAISHTAGAVMFAIAHLGSSGEPITIDTLIRLVGRGRGSVYKAIKELKTLGLIDESIAARTNVHGTGAGYVYAIRFGGACKIGKSINPASRIGQISAMLPNPVTTLAVARVGNMSETETSLHRRYKSARLNGEWFQLDEQQTSELLLFMRSLDLDAPQARSTDR